MIIHTLEEIRTLFESTKYADNSLVRVDQTDFDACMGSGSKQCAVSITGNHNHEAFVKEAQQEINECAKLSLKSCIIIFIAHNPEAASNFMTIELVNEVTANLHNCDTIMGITSDATLQEDECRILFFGAYD